MSRAGSEHGSNRTETRAITGCGVPASELRIGFPVNRPETLFGTIRALLFVAALAGAWLGAPAAAAESVSPEGLRAAQETRAIFEAKCLDCHGPELPRPKGKFGYVLDLKRVAENPDYVVRGHPEKSDLYQMVFDDEMPGEDSNVPALTAQEKETVKRWIELGAPGEPADAREREASAVTIAAVEKPAEPFLLHGLRWLGQFHPLSTHFPVALMMVALAAEGLAFATRRESWMQTVRFLVIVAALGALAATPLGWINAAFSSYNKTPYALLWWHRWLGTGAGVWAVVCAAASLMGECREGSRERWRFRVALVLGAVLVGVSGFLGSALIYGIDHYQWK